MSDALEDMTSAQRKARIHELLSAELRATGDMEPGDIATRWLTIVACHGVDEDGDEFGPVFHVGSDPMPDTWQLLGLMEMKRMEIQARMNAVYADDAEGDD